MVTIHGEPDVFRQRPYLEVAMFIECLRGHSRLTKNVVHLMAMKAGLFLHTLVRVARPTLVAWQLSRRFRRAGEVRRGTVEVPLRAPRVVVVGQHTQERGDECGFGYSGGVRDIIASAENAIDSSFGG